MQIETFVENDKVLSIINNEVLKALGMSDRRLSMSEADRVVLQRALEIVSSSCSTMAEPAAATSQPQEKGATLALLAEQRA